MTAISSLSAAQPLAVVNVAPVTPSTAVAAASADVAAPSSIVTLGQDSSVIGAQTYTVRGVINNPDVPPVWEYTAQDKVSLNMAANFSTSSGISQFKGLGVSVLTQMAQTGKDVSQSVIRSSTGKNLEPAELTAAQAKLRSSSPDNNSISLTLKTASGKNIELILSSNDSGLSVQANVSGGELNDDELLALGKMADGFQAAIDGLSAKPPQLKLDGLTQFNSKVFSSIDLSTRFKLDDGSIQTLELQADSSQRSVRMSGPSGDLNISVDLKNAAILGNSDQQAKALKSYVNQIEAARKRGDGDSQLLSMFEDAFKTLHSQYPGTRQTTASQVVNAIALNDTDHGLLTGLADFSASVREKTEASNPMRPDELDSFAYNLSQSTQSKGRDQLKRTLVQDQQSNLVASFHKPLVAGQKLELSRDAESQNYLYYEINDSASSKTRVGYEKGELVQATVTQSASQSTRVSRYVMGHLVEQTLTPVSASKTQNLLGVLQQALQQDKAAKLGRGTSWLSDVLASTHEKVLLQSDPALLKD